MHRFEAEDFKAKEMETEWDWQDLPSNNLTWNWYILNLCVYILNKIAFLLKAAARAVQRVVVISSLTLGSERRLLQNHSHPHPLGAPKGNSVKHLLLHIRGWKVCLSHFIIWKFPCWLQRSAEQAGQFRSYSYLAGCGIVEQNKRQKSVNLVLPAHFSFSRLSQIL